VPRAGRWTAAGAAALSLLMLMGALGSPITERALVVLGLALGAAVSLWLGRRDGVRPVLLRVTMVVAIVAALGSVALSAREVDSLLGALRGPLPDLLVLLTVLQGFEVLDRRSLRVHQAITLAVAAYAAGLRIDAALGWWLAAWGTCFLASVLLSTGRQIPRTATARPASLARRAGWTAGAAAATIAVLAVVPIPDGPASLGLPALSVDAPVAEIPGALAGPDGIPVEPGPTTDRTRIGDAVGYPGFTDQLDTSVRGDLGDEVVMRVRSPEPAFWRGQTFADFDGRTWTVSGGTGRLAAGPDVVVPPTLGDVTRTDLERDELVQTYFVETDLPNLVFAAYRPIRLIVDGDVWTRPDGALRSDVTMTAGSVYTAVSERIRVTADVLRDQGDLGARFATVAGTGFEARVVPFLQLPESTSDRTIELATRLRGATTYDTIVNYQAWLAENTVYDLDAPVPADGADAVDDYLFRSRRGFCEQIASTLAVMLRSQGVPARLATGYVSGERDRVSGVWTVRARDAHSWVEVWFPETGWEAFDPTADVPLAGDADRGTVGGDLAGAVVDGAVSHAEVLAVGGAVLAAGWAVLRLVRRARRRRARGRWGLLQDRFAALAPGDDDDARGDAAPPTNVDIAERVGDDRARTVAHELDRAAFDPTWVDDDDAYERARSDLRELER
jgi:transglutaminase-like putative cysteine protease